MCSSQTKLPFLDMPAAMHFWYRQNRQRLRVWGLTKQRPSYLHRYDMYSTKPRRKNFCQQKQWHTSNVIVQRVCYDDTNGMINCNFLNFITARCKYASAVLEVVILSVCLSVCLSHACFVTKPNTTMHCGYFDITWKGNYSANLTPTVVGERRSFRLKFALRVTQPLPKTQTSTVLLITSQL